MRNGGEWTEARFRSFITSAIRAASRRWPPKFKALKQAFVGKKVNAKTGKMAMHYECSACKQQFVAADVQVDHIDPVVDPKTGFVSWDVFIDRMFCEIDGLQVMCRGCHAIKTQEEKQIAADRRRVDKLRDDGVGVEKSRQSKKVETKKPRKVKAICKGLGKSE